MKHDASTPMTGLAQFVSLSNLVQRERPSQSNFDLLLFYKLSEALQEGSGGTVREGHCTDAKLLRFLLRERACDGDQGSPTF
jgi:hypothetical protein